MRNAWIGTACALLALGALSVATAAPPPARLYYDVLDGKKLVGHLDITVEPSAQGFVLRQRGEIVLKRLLLTAKVKQTIEERWQDGRLLALKSATSSELPVGSSSKSLFVVRDSAGTLRVTTDETSRELPSDALPLSIWSGRTLTNGPHFDLTGGEPIELVAASSKDPERAVSYQGQACRYSRFEAVNGSKRSVVAAWVGPDDIVCQLIISSRSDVFTYLRQPPP